MENQAQKFAANEEFDEIDLREVFLVLYRYRLMIIAITLVTTLTALTISVLMPKTYQVQRIVSLDRIDTAPIKAADAQAVLQEDGLVRQALSKLSINRDPNEFKLQAQAIKDSSLVKVTLEGPNAQEVSSLGSQIINDFLKERNNLVEARLQGLKSEMEMVNQELDRLAKTEESLQKVVDSLATLPAENVYATLFALQFSQLMDLQKQNKNALMEQKIALQDKIASIQKAQIAVPLTPPKVVKPRILLNTAVALVLGLMAGIFTAYLQNYFKNNPLYDRATTV